MGIFNRNDRQTDIKNGKTIVATGTRVCGTIEVDCNLHIDGKVDGEIKSKNSIVVGKDGSVIGDITANMIIVSGVVEGNIDAESVEIVSGGLIKGSVSSKDLIIQKDGVFKGESKPLMDDSTNEPKKLQEKK